MIKILLIGILIWAIAGLLGAILFGKAIHRIEANGADD